jgi:hypothetical protein
VYSEYGVLIAVRAFRSSFHYPSSPWHCHGGMVDMVEMVYIPHVFSGVVFSILHTVTTIDFIEIKQ